MSTVTVLELGKNKNKSMSVHLVHCQKAIGRQISSVTFPFPLTSLSSRFTHNTDRLNHRQLAFCVMVDSGFEDLQLH